MTNGRLRIAAGGAGCAAVGAALLATCSIADAAAQSSAQRACTNTLNSGAAAVAKAVARTLVDCIKDAQAGTLPPGQTAEQCLGADNDGRIAAATDASLEAETENCTSAPDFGPVDATTVSAAFTA